MLSYGPFDAALSTLRIMEDNTTPQTKSRSIFVFILLLVVLAAVAIFGYFAVFSRPATTVILVRHAEKKIEPTNPDPDLTSEGEARAKLLGHMLSGSGVNAILVSQFKRTQQTAKPLSDATGIPLTLTDAKQPEDVVKRILTAYRGQTIFVAGHNNTVPAIVSGLSGQTYPVIPESEYDNMYIVTVYRFGRAKVVQLKYGLECTQGVGNGTMVPMNK